jgi:hypothetical protein
MLCVAHLGKSLVLTDLSILISLECTPDDICVPCHKLVETARHEHEKRTLSFCACIRTRVVQVNPYEGSKSLDKSSENDILLMICHVRHSTATCAGFRARKYRQISTENHHAQFQIADYVEPTSSRSRTR